MSFVNFVSRPSANAGPSTATNPRPSANPQYSTNTIPSHIAREYRNEGAISNELNPPPGMRPLSSLVLDGPEEEIVLEESDDSVDEVPIGGNREGEEENYDDQDLELIDPPVCWKNPFQSRHPLSHIGIEHWSMAEPSDPENFSAPYGMTGPSILVEEEDCKGRSRAVLAMGRSGPGPSKPSPAHQSPARPTSPTGQVKTMTKRQIL